MNTQTTNKGEDKMKTKTYTIKRVHIEGTQMGFAVMVDTSESRRPGQVAHYNCNGLSKRELDEAYNNACAAVQSIKRGRWVASRGDWTLSVNGRKLIATKKF